MKKSDKKGNIYKNYLKDTMDSVISSFALVALSPVIAAIALLVRIKLGSPVVFRQARPGKNEKIFYMYKFRSMTDEKDKDGKLLPDKDRLTPFGKLLRATSADELLGIINVWKGDMSIIGPRPLSIYYLPHYSKKSRRRHTVKPGLTGLAQINGRNTLDWDDRFNYDIKYVDNMSLSNDIKILLATIGKVVKKDGVVVRGTTKKVNDFGVYTTLKEEGQKFMANDKMTYSETGSFFWLDKVPEKTEMIESLSWLPESADSAFTFSGRSAIDMALRDMLSVRKIKKIYVPSYCCVSMLQSFIDNNIETVFYDVTIKGGVFSYNVDYNTDCDAVLIMSYFGMQTEKVDEIIRKFKQKGVTVIEDITHSLLNKKSYSESGDYVVASLRKWFAIPTGGWIGKLHGKLAVKPNMDSDHAVQEKIDGMLKKYEYISGKIDEKEEFLLIQSKFDNDLIHTDRMLKIDSVSATIMAETDVKQIADRRKRNARILIDGIRDMNDVIKLPKGFSDDVTPLFLPVFLKSADRDSLRQYLIQRGVYCPVHWNEVMGASVGVRRNELSIICDQRYSDKDMNAIVDYIHEWYNQKKS